MKMIVPAFFLSTFICFVSYAEVKQNGEEDILSSVSNKLAQINQRLKDHRIFVTPAVVKWTELEQFQAELMFTAAHDPYGFIDKETPKELNPSFLTQKLKGSWNQLEASAFQIGEVTKSIEWMNTKLAMDDFFDLREKSLYQPARKMVSSGHLITLLSKVKEKATNVLKGNEDLKNVSVKIVDPVIEKMSRELSIMNRSVRELVEFRTPAPVEEPTFLNRVHINELTVIVGLSFLSGLFISLSFVWIKSRSKKVFVEEKVKEIKNSFNYHHWLKDLEKNLLALKDNENTNCEDLIKLKELSGKLHLSRKYLNSADNQQDYYTSLEELNASAPKIEEYFEKANLRKDSDISRRVIKQIIQLCEAIETKKEMSFEDEVPKLRLINQEKMRQVKVA